MSDSGFEWVIHPDDEIIPNLEKFGHSIEAGVYIVATRWGQQIQDDARIRVDSEKIWQTRSGAAQGGLFFAVDGFGMGTIQGEIDPKAKSLMEGATVESGTDNTLIITLGHTVFYGKYLELSNGGRHAVIMSTIERNLPDLERMLQNAGEGLFTAEKR